MSQSPTGFVADVALRIVLPQTRRGRARLGVAVLLALLLELGVGGVVWRGGGFAPIPPQEEIPVEIVVEPTPTPTPPPPAPPPPPPEMKSQEEYEKPATDAPRAGKSDHDDEHVSEKEKPAADQPPPSPVASPSPEASKPVETPEPTPSPEASKPPETPSPELPKEAEAEAPPPKEVEPSEAPPPPKPTVNDALSKTFADVPDIDFGGVAMQSPVTGGHAKSTYLTQLYGLIMPHFHPGAIALGYGRKLTGSVFFAVDGRGRLIQRFVSEKSGSMELDEAAMQAVAAASRNFPKPPHGQSIGITFNYDAM